jgi:formyltetrahydrofolate-dependent phosphoribosylglycinamide formyltransferase
MLKKWKEKWQVSWVQFTLIICTFALGGSLCGFTGRKLLTLTGIEKGVLYLLLYIITMTIVWPFCVILVSIPLGQFYFFKNYLYKMWGRISRKSSIVNRQSLAARRIAIFASGAGSNAQKIIEHLQGNAFINVGLIVCNKPEAGVLTIAANHHIPTLLIDKDIFFKRDAYITTLKQDYNIEFIVLAGFLWKIPMTLIKAYPNKIINIHPALLPKHGGKGMYGHFVHQAVLANGDTESGITIHYVNEHFDEGKTIFQAKCQITAMDTPDSLAAKVHQLEHQYYPQIVEKIVLAADGIILNT